MKKFRSFEEFEAWADSFEEIADYEMIPVTIDDGNKIMMDMTTKCKSWKTALRRFEKAFAGQNEEVGSWVEGMTESCNSKCFEDRLNPGWTATEEEKKQFFANGTYSWGVEEVNEGVWYIFLNISGVYAGR